MAVLGLDHVQIAIPAGGEDRERAFLTVLGMIEVAKPATLAATGCWFEGGGARLHVGIDPDFTPATKAHPALLVDDLSALRERLEEAGYRTRDDTPLEGYARFFTQDPFGNRIELMQRL